MASSRAAVVALNYQSFDVLGTVQIFMRFAMLFPAIILHEISHGYVAYLLGDPTAKRAGRLTLNPIAHIDPIGTVVMPLALLFLSGGAFFFGYAKPVPFNPRNFKDERTGMLLTGIAGPVTNIVLAIVFGLASRLLRGSGWRVEPGYLRLHRGVPALLRLRKPRAGLLQPRADSAAGRLSSAAVDPS